MYGNKFLSECQYNQTNNNYWCDRKLWFESGTGYYLSDWRSAYWYNDVKACTNAPANAHYIGAGTPDEPVKTGGATDYNDCPWECDDGYMLYEPTGKCVLKCEPGYALDSDMEKCVSCVVGTYSDVPGAIECTPCPTATNSANVTGYGNINYDKPYIRDSRKGCYAWFGEKMMTDGSMTRYWCYIDPDADTYGESGKSWCGVYTKELKCSGGYYSDLTESRRIDGFEKKLSATELFDNVCVPVGAGYYSSDGDTEAHACPAGTSTIGYGPGADEASDCGHALHVGDHTIHLRAEKRTPHTLNVRIGNTIFYGDMSTPPKGKVRIKMGDTVYSVHDDSM